MNNVLILFVCSFYCDCTEMNCSVIIEADRIIVHIGVDRIAQRLYILHFITEHLYTTCMCTHMKLHVCVSVWCVCVCVGILSLRNIP